MRYIPYKNTTLWSAESLYVGASFVRTSLGPVTVSLKANESTLAGTLYFMDPNTGNPIPLFQNKAPVGTKVILSDLIDIPIGKSLTFGYQVHGSANPADSKIKYSGPNTPGEDYVSEASSNANVMPNLRFGHRWAVVGNVSATSMLELGFEDLAYFGSDMDFNDIIFQVEGLKMGIFRRDLKDERFLR
jgi:hypothetical protein